MIKMRKRTLIFIIISAVMATAIIACAGIFVGLSKGDVIVVNREKYEKSCEIAEKFNKFYNIQNDVSKKFLWKYDEEKLMDAAYKGYVSALEDQYSQYMNAEETKEWQDLVTGTFTGVGIVFEQRKDKKFYVVEVVGGSPAEASGIKSGDVILKVDGKEYLNADVMKAHLRGKKGSKVAVTYERKGKKKTVSITRAEIKDRSVFSSVLKNNIGYIRIKSFEVDTGEAFKKELTAMENKNVKGLIVDIRNNGGGLVDEGVKIADALLPEGTITYIEDKNGRKNYYNSDEKCTKLPFVLLVNQYSASTSEILAGAVKDNKKGAVVGSQTFGKGIVQGTVDLNDGSSLKLTMYQYFSPKGKVIHNNGIKPDYTVNLKANAKTDKQLEKAVSLLKKRN